MPSCVVHALEMRKLGEFRGVPGLLLEGHPDFHYRAPAEYFNMGHRSTPYMYICRQLE